MFSFTGVSTGCWTTVGRKGGAQPINLHKDCLNKKEKEARRKVKHEILHALGFGTTSLNDFYNEVGFGTEKNLTATDKIALNVLYDCPDVKRKMYNDFIKEEVFRNYVELMQLKINPNEASKRY